MAVAGVAEGHLPDWDDPHDIDRMAVAIWALTMRWPKWIHRRTQRVTLLSEGELRVTVTLDFTVPDVSQWTGQPVPLLELPFPLTLHRKDILTGFTMHDAAGRALSMLTVAQDRVIIRRMLLGLADGVLEGEAIEESLRDDLSAIVGDADVAEPALDRLNNLTERRAGSQRQRVLKDTMVTLANELARSFLITTMLPFQPGHRHVISYSYYDRVESSGNLLGFLIGARQRTGYPTRAPMGTAGSFHGEWAAPPGLVFSAAESKAEFHLAETKLWRPPTSGHVPEDEPFATGRVDGNTLTVYARNQPRGAYVECIPRFLPEPHGVGVAAPVVAALTCLLFLAAIPLRLAFSIGPRGDVAASVLVALPAAYAAYFAERERHLLTRRLTRGPRRAILLAAFWAALGAGALALAFPKAPRGLESHGIGWRFVTWGGIAVLALFSFGATTSLAIRRWRGSSRGMLQR